MKIICIAGGIWQKPWIAHLKNQGNYIAVVNPVSTDATRLADIHIQADINDLNTINQHIEKICPDRITSDQSDVSTMIVSVLSEKWGLPGNSVQTVKRLTDKFEIYNFGMSIGVPVPKSTLAFGPNDIANFGAANGFPIIIKPVDSTMSRGFRKIESPQEITQELFETSVRFSKTKLVIVQDFIDGEMVTLEGVCSGGKHRTIAVSKKTGYFKPGINHGVRYPYDSPLIEAITNTNDTYVEKSGMEFGLTHSEYIINGDNFCLIEIGGRGGGAGITDKIVPWVSGVDVYDVFYNSLIGNTVNVKEIKPFKRSALLKYYAESQVEKFNEEKRNLISQIKGVADFNYNFANKQYVFDTNDIRHSMGIYLAENPDELDELHERINQILEKP